jgi:hypothetical protein
MKPQGSIQQDTKKHYEKGYPERQHKGMAKTMGGSNEMCDYKRFLSKYRKRLAVNLNLSPNLTTIMTGYGNIRSYLHRLKLIGSQSAHSNAAYIQYTI